MNSQPSAPSYQTYHGRWQQSAILPSDNHVPPLFDYELYRESRNRDQIELSNTRNSGFANDQGCLGLSTMMHSYYESPHDQTGMHHNLYSTSKNALQFGSSSIRSAVGPPVYMTGGGYELNPFKKTQKSVTVTENWNPALSQQSNGAPQRNSSGRELENQQQTPFLSVAIALTHLVTLIMVMMQNDCPDHTTETCLFPSLKRFSFQPFNENPLLGPSAKTLLTMGALESDLITKARDGWRLLSAMWLHAGVLHMIGNDLGMMVLAFPLERQMGFIKVGVIYLLSGFMGSILSAVMVQGRVSVGASGALMGLLGATLSAVIVNWKTYPSRSKTLAAVVFFMALNSVYGLMPLVDNFMHVGGALMGFLVGNLFQIRHSFRCWKSSVVYDQEDMPAKRKHAILLDIVWLLSLGTVLAFGIMGLFALFSGMNISSTCPWCQYLTCAPSRFWTCSGNRQLGCNPSSVSGGLRVTCANGQFSDYSNVQFSDRITPEIQSLCVKSCV